MDVIFSLRARIASIFSSGLLEADAPVGHLAGFFQHAGHVEQGLRRDTTAQQAGAAEPGVRVDQDDVHPHVRGQKRRRVSARPAAENCQLSLHAEIASIVP